MSGSFHFVAMKKTHKSGACIESDTIEIKASIFHLK